MCTYILYNVPERFCLFFFLFFGFPKNFMQRIFYKNFFFCWKYQNWIWILSAVPPGGADLLSKQKVSLNSSMFIDRINESIAEKIKGAHRSNLLPFQHMYFLIVDQKLTKFMSNIIASNVFNIGFICCCWHWANGKENQPQKKNNRNTKKY